MGSPLDPIKAAVKDPVGKHAITVNNNGSQWTVVVNGYVDTYPFSTQVTESTLEKACERVMARINELRGQT